MTTSRKVFTKINFQTYFHSEESLISQMFNIFRSRTVVRPWTNRNAVQSYIVYTEKKIDDTNIIVVPWPKLYWRFTENQGFLVSVQPVCVFQLYELLLQQYFWLTVKYILFNYLKIFSYIHMTDKSQAFLSVYIHVRWLLPYIKYPSGSLKI